MSDPDYRFSFANERTFLAWIRTALALLVGGLALTQLTSISDDTWRRLLVGGPPVIAAIVLSIASLRHWEDAENAMRTDSPLPLAKRPRNALVAFIVIWAVAAAIATLVP